MLGAILEWYFDEEDFPQPEKSQIVRLLRLFVVYPIVILLSFVFLFFVFLYRLLNTYILKRDVTNLMDGIAWTMHHITMCPKL